MPNTPWPNSITVDINTPNPIPHALPRRVERQIAAQWLRWEPWLIVDLKWRRLDSILSAELSRLQRRHRDYLLRLIRAGIEMRIIRKHRLDDPRIADDLRALRLRATLARRRDICTTPQLDLSDEKAWTKRFRATACAELLNSLAHQSPPRDQITASVQSTRGVTIELVQKWVTAHFRLFPEELQIRTNRSVIVFPRQLAMYLARQLTTASLEEIGRHFGGNHHTTVLHSVGRIDALRRSDEDLDRRISSWMQALGQTVGKISPDTARHVAGPPCM